MALGSSWRYVRRPSPVTADSRMKDPRAVARHSAWCIPLVVGQFAISGCSAKAEQQPPARDGTARMADTLSVLYRQAIADPRGNMFLNRERADAIQTMLVSQSGNEALNIRYLVAQERLMAGQTREAITQLES